MAPLLTIDPKSWHQPLRFHSKGQMLDDLVIEGPVRETKEPVVAALIELYAN